MGDQWRMVIHDASSYVCTCHVEKTPNKKIGEEGRSSPNWDPIKVVLCQDVFLSQWKSFIAVTKFSGLSIHYTMRVRISLLYTYSLVYNVLLSSVPSFYYFLYMTIYDQNALWMWKLNSRSHFIFNISSSKRFELSWLDLDQLVIPSTVFFSHFSLIISNNIILLLLLSIFDWYLVFALLLSRYCSLINWDLDFWIP